jgi:hypothetical protein
MGLFYFVSDREGNGLTKLLARHNTHTQSTRRQEPTTSILSILSPLSWAMDALLPCVSISSL